MSPLKKNSKKGLKLNQKQRPTEVGHAGRDKVARGAAAFRGVPLLPGYAPVKGVRCDAALAVRAMSHPIQ